MRLTWINTVHGSLTDPQSGETNLKTPDKETTVLKMGGTSQRSLDSYLAIGIFRSGAERYAMVFNKDLNTGNGPITQTIDLNGTHYNPKQFNKSTGIWEQPASLAITKNSATNTTSFTVDQLAGTEMRLFRLNTDITPAINLLLND